MNISALYDSVYSRIQCLMVQKAHIKEFKNKTEGTVLTRKQNSAIDDFYRDYKKPSHVFHNFYTEKTGIFCENYIPDDLWYGYIDPHFNNLKEGKFLDNKCYYSSIFEGIPQPRTLLRRMNGILYVGGYRTDHYRSRVAYLFRKGKSCFHENCSGVTWRTWS